MSKKKKGLSGLGGGFMDGYNNMPDNMKTRSIHAAVDIASAGVGGVIGKFCGPNAALLGVGIIVTGNLAGDKSGISRAIGVGLMAYGIGKYTDDHIKSASTEKPTVKTRLTEYKNELLGAFRLGNLFKKKTDEDEKVPAVAAQPVGSLSALDMSSLDFFDDLNEQQAAEFEARRQPKIESAPQFGADEMEAMPMNNFGVSGPEFNYTILDEDDDLSDL